jgi:hypothetical protein
MHRRSRSRHHQHPHGVALALTTVGLRRTSMELASSRWHSYCLALLCSQHAQIPRPWTDCRWTFAVLLSLRRRTHRAPHEHSPTAMPRLPSDSFDTISNTRRAPISSSLGPRPCTAGALPHTHKRTAQTRLHCHDRGTMPRHSRPPGTQAHAPAHNAARPERHAALSARR